jgi:hypothetical protein
MGQTIASYFPEALSALSWDDFKNVSTKLDLNDIPNDIFEDHLETLNNHPDNQRNLIVDRLTLNWNWIQRIGKCDLVIRNYSNFTIGHQRTLLNAIKQQEFDIIKAYISFFSPQNLILNLELLNDEIRKEILLIANVQKHASENNPDIVSCLQLRYPIFFLPTLGASDELTKKVYELLDHWLDNQYCLFQIRNLKSETVLKIQLHDPFTFLGIGIPSTLGPVMKTSFSKHYATFEKINNKNGSLFITN